MMRTSVTLIVAILTQLTIRGALAIARFFNRGIVSSTAHDQRAG